MSLFKVLVAVEPRPGTVRRQYPASDLIEAASSEEAIAKGVDDVRSRGFAVKPDDQFTFAIELGLTRDDPLPIDLFDFLKDRGVDLAVESGDGYCVTSGRPSYSDWEKTKATPALERAGAELLWCWVDSERDSFGPLSRSVRVKHRDRFYDVIYG